MIDRQHGLFGVFDGHGGKGAAAYCKAEVASRVELLRGALGLEGAFRQVCWEMDSALGAAGDYSGTTATLAWVSEDGRDVTLAWVGDSAAVRLRGSAPPEVTPLHATEGPYALEDEVTRLETQWSARKALPTGASHDLELLDTMQQKALPGSRPRLLRDSLEREKVVRSSYVAQTDFSYTNSERAQSCIRRRKDPLTGEASGPKTVVAEFVYSGVDVDVGGGGGPASCEHSSGDGGDGVEEDEARPVAPTPTGARKTRWEHLQTPPSARPSKTTPKKSKSPSSRGGRSRNRVTTVTHDTQMTRSIGDWDCSLAIIPEPSFWSWTLEQNERLIIASDGLWDILDPKVAAKAIQKIGDPQKAADTLLSAVKAVTRNLGGPGLKDDTTILVLDVAPNGHAVAQPCACQIS